MNKITQFELRWSDSIGKIYIDGWWDFIRLVPNKKNRTRPKGEKEIRFFQLNTTWWWLLFKLKQQSPKRSLKSVFLLHFFHLVHPSIWKENEHEHPWKTGFHSFDADTHLFFQKQKTQNDSMSNCQSKQISTLDTFFFFLLS